MDRRAARRSRDAISLSTPTEIIDDAAMLNHDALRHARRTRRVDHISEIVPVGLVRQICFLFISHARPIRIEADRGHCALRQRFEQMRLRQQQARSGIFQDEGHALARVSRINRHVCAARFEHREHADHHL
jgi:hypothetical protein